jgi:anti-sigma factor RsiW
MKDQSDTNLCARALDLVTYLYGEASEPEATEFEAHMRLCVSCATELEAFGHVRASVGDWRQQTLATIPSTALKTGLAPATETSVATPSRGRSALVALREFFALSPMWLRAGTAFASLALCALVVFAAVRLMEAPRVVVVEKIVKQGPSQAEINELVDRKVQEELASRNQREDTSPQPVVTTAEQNVPVVARSTASRSDSLSRRGNTQRHALAQVSTQESEQFARDLQLIPTRDDENVPRLIDLMDEAN